MKEKIDFMRLYIISLLLVFSGSLFSQNMNSVRIKLPYRVYFDSPCVTINKCVDSMYQSSDTLFLLFIDNRKRSDVRVRANIETNTDDTNNLYLWDVISYPITIHTIKIYNIRLLIPSCYVDYAILGVKLRYSDEICFFKKKKQMLYKYIGKKNLTNNRWYKRNNRDIPKWYFKKHVWASDSVP